MKLYDLLNDLGKKGEKMGGYFSGFKGTRKLTVQEVLSINVNKLGISRTSIFDVTYKWESGDSIGISKYNENNILLYYTSTINEVTKDYGDVIHIDYTPCNYGGERAWFICPSCNKKVGKIYIKSGFFKCRICNQLNYSIQQASMRHRQIMEKDLKMYKIQDALKIERGVNNIFNIQKPKGMHHKTYEEYVNSLKELFLTRERLFLRLIEEIGNKKLL